MSNDASPGGLDQQREIAERTIHRLLDFCGVRIRPLCQKDVRLAVRRLTVLAWMLRRDGFDSINGADIAREFHVTKQAVNLDTQRLSRTLKIASPTAHATSCGRPPSWVRRGVE